MPRNMKFDDSINHDENEIKNVFAKYFFSVYVVDSTIELRMKTENRNRQ